MALKKVPVKKLIEYRTLPKERRSGFVNRLSTPKLPTGGGGNYWVRSISAISNAFKKNDNSLILDKINEIMELYDVNQHVPTKIMYERNINILNKYKNFDFEIWRPTVNLDFLNKKPDSILEMSGLPIQIRPNHIFKYGARNNRSIGGIWFVTRLEGYGIADLGIYSEALYRYLSSYFSKDYIINASACIVINISSGDFISYNDILDEQIPSLLDPTLKLFRESL